MNENDKNNNSSNTVSKHSTRAKCKKKYIEEN